MQKFGVLITVSCVHQAQPATQCLHTRTSTTCYVHQVLPNTLASQPKQSDAAARGWTPLVQGTQAQPQHAVYTQSSQPHSADPKGHHQQASLVQRKQLPVHHQLASPAQSNQRLSAGHQGYYQPGRKVCHQLASLTQSN